MKISIAMATYNGARYLREQLESFSCQTRQLDELVICDDSSSDGSWEILEEFSQKSAFNVKLLRNEKRLGFVANFSRAVQACTGDLIFLGDQDDVWFPNKLERVELFFASHPSTWVVVNDARITDEALQTTGLTVAGQLLSAGINLNELTTGCCTAFRSILKPVAFPVPEDEKWHDGWIHKLGIMFHAREFLPEVLQSYRRHASNVTNGSPSVTVNTGHVSRWHAIRRVLSRENLSVDPLIACEIRLKQFQFLKSHIENHFEYLSSDKVLGDVACEVLSGLDAQCKANEIRRSILRKGIMPRLFSAINFYCAGGYKQFGGFKSLAKDVFMAGTPS